ncbi:MAG TPA: hypothetical protein VK506_06210 [Conexibacter sp.]|nr:hypothetical protein [Conexibacter sp.]
MLPELARWFVEHVQTVQPDAFVPVETKGARLLESILAYAHHTLGAPLQVPVLYTPALAYVDPAELADWHLALLDDATRTGRALARHRARVERYGAQHVSLLACVGLDDPAEERLADMGLEGLACFRHVGGEAYRELVWQLAELVVARGLPPEVDHHVFRLAMRGSLADSWATLVDRLQRFGDLSIDGPVTTSADVVSMTLHFPAFPDVPRYPSSGAVRDEGVKKLRLFADLRQGLIFVVPMAFPALALPRGVNHRNLPEELCHEVVAEWTRGRETVADLMLTLACTRDADMLFRAVSTATEVDLVCGFARMLGDELSGATLALTAERSLFGRLYGQAVGERLADSIDGEIAAAFVDQRDSEQAQPVSLPSGAVRRVRQVDAEVVTTTVEIAKYLKWWSGVAAEHSGADPLKRVGLSLTELRRHLTIERVDLLLLSRCIDYGLAMTTLVPFTDVDVLDDGSVEARRKYGVSEVDPFDDLRMHRRQLREETIALIARALCKPSSPWPDRVPLEVVARVAAILNPALQRYDLALDIEHAPMGPQLMLDSEAGRTTIYAAASEFFTLEGDAIVPTGRFADAYEQEILALDRCDGTGHVESNVKALLPVLAAASDVEGLLLAWSVRVGRRMGMEVVEHHLRCATEQLLLPLAKLRRGDQPDPNELVDAAQRGRELIAAAEETVELLATDLADELRARFSDPDRAQQRLLESLATPSHPDALLRIARQTCEMAVTLAAQVEALVEWPIDGEDDEVARQLATQVADATEQLEREATTLARDGGLNGVPDDPTGLGLFAANCVTRGAKLVRARAAALAWTNRGVPLPDPGVDGAMLRRSTVLAADLSGSTPRSQRDRHGDNVDWVTLALDLVTQWGRAFGGAEIVRNGDEVMLEFEHADGALLCAAVVQVHVTALRTTGRPLADWEFRIAVADGQVTGLPGNVVGAPLNVASKLAKFRKGDADAIRRVLVTPQVAEGCSSALREALTSMDEVLDLDPDLSMGIDAARMRLTPQRLEALAAVENLLAVHAEFPAADAPA